MLNNKTYRGVAARGCYCLLSPFCCWMRRKEGGVGGGGLGAEEERLAGGYLFTELLHMRVERR